MYQMTHAARQGWRNLTDAQSVVVVDNGAVIERLGSQADRRVTELVELGRDREAAHLGALTQGELMHPLAQLDELGPLLGGVVSAITPAELDNKTPCAEFTVRGVLEHMIGGATQFAAAFRGQTPAAPDLSDVLGSFGPALGALGEAMHSVGALDRDVEAPFGTVPGETFARFVVLDGLVHGWDLATATGQSYEPSDELVGAVEAFGQTAIPPLRDGVTFGAEIAPAASATPIERLAALTGRQR
jgi:uncharacterized protein (TIGR03086 family)